jgi:hypothetical protein
MNDFLKKYKAWLIAGITGILIGGSLLFVAYSLIGKIKATSNTVQEKTIDSENNQSRIAKIPELEAAARSFQERESDLDATMDESKEIDFIKKLEALAEITGNKISLKIDEAVQKKAEAAKSGKDAKETILGGLPYDKYITVQINLEGGYSELINFIHKIENSGFYLNVISINSVKNASKEAETQKDNSPFNASHSAADKITFEKETIKTVITIVVYLKKE